MLRSIATLTPKDYRNPDQLEPGGVLVVGASRAASRSRKRSIVPAAVTLAVGDHVRVPRVYRGRDIQWWMDAAGVLDERYDEVDDIVRARSLPSLQLVGSPERATFGSECSHRRRREACRASRRHQGWQGPVSGSLRNQCALADLKMARLLDTIDEWATSSGLADEVGASHRFDPTTVDASPPLGMDLTSGEIRTIVWATGFRPDFSWLDAPVFDRKGQIQHDGGVVKSPGMHLMGMPFLRPAKIFSYRRRRRRRPRAKQTSCVLPRPTGYDDASLRSARVRSEQRPFREIRLSGKGCKNHLLKNDRRRRNLREQDQQPFRQLIGKCRTAPEGISLVGSPIGDDMTLDISVALNLIGARRLILSRSVGCPRSPTDLTWSCVSTALRNLLRLVSIVFPIFLCYGADALEILQDFESIRGVQARVDGGFVAVGQLRDKVDGFSQSAAVFLDEKGRQEGSIFKLPPPPTGQLGTVVYALARLPEGDFVAAGSVGPPPTGRDWWLIRFTASRRIVFNRSETWNLDEAFYSVKLLSGGLLLAVGRQQADNAPARSVGLAVNFDEMGDPVGEESTFVSGESPRAAFRDFTQHPDGSVVFTGWTTSPDNFDQVWIVQTGDRGEVPPFGEKGSDLGLAAATHQNGTLIAGILRDQSGEIGPTAGFVAAPDAALAEFPKKRISPGLGEARALLSYGSGGPALIGGWQAPMRTTLQTAYLAEADLQGGEVSLRERELSRPDGVSHILAMAVSEGMNVGLVGEAAATVDGPFYGFTEVVPARGVCSNGESTLRQAAGFLSRPGGNVILCSEDGSPVTLKIKAESEGMGLSVRPILGDVDVLLTSGDSPIDASVNRDRAPEFVALPTTSVNLEVSVVKPSKFSVFGISAVEIEEKSGTEPTPDARDEEDSDYVPNDRAIFHSLGLLGYDLFFLSETEAHIRSFQATAGVPVTGGWTKPDLSLLLARAALRAGELARIDADLARRVSGVSSNTATGDLSFAGAMIEQRLVGVGLTSDGFRFEGAWAIEPDKTKRPMRGEVHLGEDCILTIESIVGSSEEDWEFDVAGFLVAAWDGDQLSYAGFVSGDGYLGREIESRSVCDPRAQG